MTNQATQEEEQEIEETQDNQQAATDTQATETEHQETAPAEEAIEQQPVKKKREWVEFSTPEQQAAYDNLFSQVKMSDNRNKMYMQWMQKQQTELDEMRLRFSQTDTTQTESILNNRHKEAREAGDEDRADKIMQEIIDFRVQKALNKTQVQQVKSQQVSEANDPDARYIDFLAKEADERGNPVRPWLNEAHPDYIKAESIARAKSQEFFNQNGFVSVPAVMKQVEAEMSKGKQPHRPQGNTRAADPFSGGNLTRNQNSNKLKLSADEASIAKKLGVSAEDYARNK